MDILSEIKSIQREIYALKSADGAKPSMGTIAISGTYVVRKPPTIDYNNVLVATVISTDVDYPNFYMSVRDINGGDLDPLTYYRLDDGMGISKRTRFAIPYGANPGVDVQYDWTATGQFVHSVEWATVRL